MGKTSRTGIQTHLTADELNALAMFKKDLEGDGSAPSVDGAASSEEGGDGGDEFDAEGEEDVSEVLSDDEIQALFDAFDADDWAEVDRWLDETERRALEAGKSLEGKKGGADRNRGGAETLRRYWTVGVGAAKIRWGTPGDFTRCVKQLRKYLGPRAKGYCALRHKEMNGVWPGDKRNTGKSADEVDEKAERPRRSPKRESREQREAREEREYRRDQVGRFAEGNSGRRDDGGKKPKKPKSDRGGREHVVVEGDTLWDIAERELGDGERWKEIRDASGLGEDFDPTKLQIGTVLSLPPKKGDGDEDDGEDRERPTRRVRRAREAVREEREELRDEREDVRDARRRLRRARDRGKVADGVAVKRKFSAEEREKAPTLPGTDSYPTPDLSALDDAIQAFGRAKPEDRERLKRYLLQRARALKAPKETVQRIENLNAEKSRRRRTERKDAPMQMEHKVVPVVGQKVVDDKTGIVETIVSVTGAVDEVNDDIKPGAYAKTLSARTPKGVWGHDWLSPVSKTLAIEELMPGDRRLPAKQRNGEPWPEGAGGLLVKTQFNLDTQRGRDAYSDVKFFGDEQEWSIGYQVPVGGAKVNTKTGVREIHTIDLYEYSPVLFGAMPMATTQSIKSVREAQAAFRESKRQRRAPSPKEVAAKVARRRRVERKDTWVNIEGSVEETLDAVRRAVQAQYGDQGGAIGLGESTWTSVEATFPDRVLYRVFGPDHPDGAHFEADYSVSNGQVTLGSPRQVRVVAAVEEIEVPGATVQGVLGALSEAGKTLWAAQETKVGRVLSSANVTALERAIKEIQSVLDTHRTRLAPPSEDTVAPKGEKSAKAKDRDYVRDARGRFARVGAIMDLLDGGDGGDGGEGGGRGKLVGVNADGTAKVEKDDGTTVDVDPKKIQKADDQSEATGQAATDEGEQASRVEAMREGDESADSAEEIAAGLSAETTEGERTPEAAEPAIAARDWLSAVNEYEAGDRPTAPPDAQMEEAVSALNDPEVTEAWERFRDEGGEENYTALEQGINVHAEKIPPSEGEGGAPPLPGTDVRDLSDEQLQEVRDALVVAANAVPDRDVEPLRAKLDDVIGEQNRRERGGDESGDEGGGEDRNAAALDEAEQDEFDELADRDANGPELSAEEQARFDDLDRRNRLHGSDSENARIARGDSSGRVEETTPADTAQNWLAAMNAHEEGERDFSPPDAQMDAAVEEIGDLDVSEAWEKFKAEGGEENYQALESALSNYEGGGDEGGGDEGGGDESGGEADEPVEVDRGEDTDFEGRNEPAGGRPARGTGSQSREDVIAAVWDAQQNGGDVEGALDAWAADLTDEEMVAVSEGGIARNMISPEERAAVDRRLGSGEESAAADTEPNVSVPLEDGKVPIGDREPLQQDFRDFDTLLDDVDSRMFDSATTYHNLADASADLDDAIGWTDRTRGGSPQEILDAYDRLSQGLATALDEWNDEESETWQELNELQARLEERARALRRDYREFGWIKSKPKRMERKFRRRRNSDGAVLSVKELMELDVLRFHV